MASLFAACGNSTDEEAAPTADLSSLQSKLDDVVAAGVPGAVVFVGDEGEEPTVLAAGVSDLKTGKALEAADRFRIGSLAKAYVAAVVLQLVDEGKLTLDTPIKKWVPGLGVPNADRITLRQLLSHSSGLFDYLADPRVQAPYLAGDFGYVWKPEQLIAVSNRHQPDFEPGADSSYSNTGYTLAGLIVEQATGNSLGAELESRIFEPLELRDTAFVTSQQIQSPYTHGYLVGNGKPLDATTVSPTYYWGAGNIVSSAEDAGRFFEALFAGEVTSDDSLAEMKKIEASKSGGEAYGLAIGTVKLPCGDGFTISGGVPGYFSQSLHMVSGKQIILLANSLTLEDAVGSVAAGKAADEVIRTAACG